MKKLKGIIIAVILTAASILMPFNVSADTIDSHIKGRNIWYEPIQSEQYNGYALNIGKFVVEIILDDDYVGYMLPNYTIQYRNYFYGSSPASWGSLQKSYQNRIFINGSAARFEVPVSWYSLNAGSAVLDGGTSSTSPYVYDSYTVTSSDVTAYGEIQSLNQIIEILQDNNDIVGDIYNELLTVVSNTDLANQYLEKISQLRQWNIPIESFSAIYLLLYAGLNPSDILSLYNLSYPIFELVNGDILINKYFQSGETDTWIFMLNGNPYNSTQLLNYVNIPTDFVISNYELIDRIRTNTTTYFVKCFIKNNGSAGNYQITSKYNLIYVPIFIHDNSLRSIKYISTDFALQWGLSNNLLDNLNIIANGTTQSNSAASDLESGNSQMADDMDDLATIENGYNQQFNNQLQQIDFSSPLQSNSGILPAANFVITIFNGLINNNPFSVLIIVVCILLIGKKVIGK